MQSGKDKVRRFFQTGYRAKSWSRERKVVARVEATAKGTDVRFVVTNLPGRCNPCRAAAILLILGFSPDYSRWSSGLNESSGIVRVDGLFRGGFSECVGG